MNNTYEKITKPYQLPRSSVESAFSYCLDKLDAWIEAHGDDFCSPASHNLMYHAITNQDADWVHCFTSGMIWLAYEKTGNEKYRIIGEKQVVTFAHRLEDGFDVSCHDVGVQYMLSCVAAYKVTGSTFARDTAIKAADTLLLRYREKGEFLQAWDANDETNNYRMIIDCLICIPLLYWATEESGEKKYANCANKHLKSTTTHIVREDYSSYHTFYFDPETGLPVGGATQQGYRDESTWARGQAWGCFGFPIAYRYTKDPALKELAKHMIEYYLHHLPEDSIPCWDLAFTDSEIQRDSSSAPVVACGILELGKESDASTDQYVHAAHYMMSALMTKYTTKGLVSNGILTSATYSLPHQKGINECNIWGDYYYMEALMRLMNPDWNPYW